MAKIETESSTASYVTRQKRIASIERTVHAAAEMPLSSLLELLEEPCKEGPDGPLRGGASVSVMIPTPPPLDSTRMFDPATATEEQVRDMLGRCSGRRDLWDGVCVELEEALEGRDEEEKAQ